MHNLQIKKNQVFVISIRNLEYPAEKEVKPEINPKNVVSKKYHDFLDVFSKKNLNTLLSYQKWNHKIILEEEQKDGHIAIYKILL